MKACPASLTAADTQWRIHSETLKPRRQSAVTDAAADLWKKKKKTPVATLSPDADAKHRSKQELCGHVHGSALSRLDGRQQHGSIS